MHEELRKYNENYFIDFLFKNIHSHKRMKTFKEKN